LGSPTRLTDPRRRAVAGSTLLFDFPHPKPVITQRTSFGFQEQARALWRLRSVFAKRCLDVALVIPLLALMLPVWLACALCIKLESPGPVFFRQKRVGLNGRIFTMYKLRSMSADAEEKRAELESQNEMPGGIIFKIRADPRITRVGTVLRRWSLDETPQFLNVALGDMSLVGPRPPVPEEVAEYTPEQMCRLRAKPGLTCLWQVSGRSEIPFDEQVRLDVRYIFERSIWLDLKILLQTIPAVLIGRGAF